jgi:D-ornithine 4,5-aminomutase subunit beta
MSMSTAISGPTRLRELSKLPLAELRDRFFTLATDVVTPLRRLAASHTTPSIERSVLLRMGFDSLEAETLVTHAADKGWLADGVAGVLRRYACERGVDMYRAYRMLLALPDGAFRVSVRSVPWPVEPIPPLDPAVPLPVDEILTGLSGYRPRRQGWTWRAPGGSPGPFIYRQVSQPLVRSGPLKAASYFDGLDPQPDCTITAEIASGRFEDDLRRMRMAVWHGADHIMVIRTLGQSHYDGLIEGTPEGVGGVPISRKQLRATRRALDLIEDEVGRPVNLHSYVSGLAGSEMAVLFAEEGINGAHQDFQYNILYRNVNPVRSVVDAFEAKRILADAGILQVDGAHNAGSTALRAWNIRPEVLVQHALNSVASQQAGMERGLIALSSVPPTAAPAPKFSLDLPFAMAVRYLFEGFVIRAQQNTRYSPTNMYEATILHVLDTLVSRLCGSDIQSTIAPDEARCVPWHYPSVQAVAGTKQVLVGLDGLAGMASLNMAALSADMTDLVARAVLMLEDIVALGGYLDALEAGLFVDSGTYPDRADDGIRRPRTSGVGAGSIVRRSDRYIADVCSHFGAQPGSAAGCHGCTICDPSLIRYIDELDAADTVTIRRREISEREDGSVWPEAEHNGDGYVTVSLFVPLPESYADAAALEMARSMNLDAPRIVDRVVLHPAEGVQFDVVGRLRAPVQRAELFPATASPLYAVAAEELRARLAPLRTCVVGATLGEDEHTVGLQEVTNIKHQGLEWFGVRCVNLGSSVPVERLLDEAVEHNALAVLASLVISHRSVHELMMRHLADVAVERGIRARFLLIAGGPQITDELARTGGLDAGFGPGTRGVDVARFLAEALSKEPDREDRYGCRPL